MLYGNSSFMSGFLYVIVLSNYTTQKCAHDELVNQYKVRMYVCVCVCCI